MKLYRALSVLAMIAYHLCMKKEGVVLVASEESTGRAESYPAATSATGCMEHCDDESSTNEVGLCRVCSLKRLKTSMNQANCHKASKVFLHIVRCVQPLMPITHYSHHLLTVYLCKRC